jgi:hypothetical protein
MEISASMTQTKARVLTVLAVGSFLAAPVVVGSVSGYMSYKEQVQQCDRSLCYVDEAKVEPMLHIASAPLDLATRQKATNDIFDYFSSKGLKYNENFKVLSGVQSVISDKSTAHSKKEEAVSYVAKEYRKLLENDRLTVSELSIKLDSIVGGFVVGMFCYIFLFAALGFFLYGGFNLR